MTERLTFSDVLVILVLIAAGLAIRLDFLFASGFVIDADEAIVGLMAKHVTEGGPVPVFYYGQDYMGSFESLLVSLGFSLFGVSNVLLKVVPLVFSLLLIAVIYLIGKQLAGRAGGAAAGLLCALPPAPLIDWSSKARGGFIEVVLLGALAFLVLLHWLKKPDYARTMLIGLLLGLGWWVNNQVIYFMLPAAFAMLCAIAGDASLTLPRKARVLTCHALLGLTAWFVGSIPFWLYNFQHEFASFGLFKGSDSKDIFEHADGLWNISLPILLGSKRFWEESDNFRSSTLVYGGLYGFLLIFVLILRHRQIAGLVRLRIDTKSPVEIFLLFMLAACGIFIYSSFGWLTQAPRYLLPLYVGIFAVCGWALAQIAGMSRLTANLLLTLLLAANLLSFYLHGRAVPGEPFVYKEERVAKNHELLIKWLEEQKINLVRTNYWIGYRLAFESMERIKFLVFQEPHFVRIPEYELKLDIIERDKVPLILVPGQAALVERALRKLGYNFAVHEVEGYKIIHQITPIHPPVDQVPDSEISVMASNHNVDSGNAIDGNIDSRWGSGGPQNPTMRFEITFNKALPVSQLIYFLGKWHHDFPRGLRVEVEDEQANREVVMEWHSTSAVAYYLQGNSEFSLYFTPRKVKRIILNQTGSDARMDWSIAELKIFAGEKL